MTKEEEEVLTAAIALAEVIYLREDLSFQERSLCESVDKYLTKNLEELICNFGQA